MCVCLLGTLTTALDTVKLYVRVICLLIIVLDYVLINVLRLLTTTVSIEFATILVLMSVQWSMQKMTREHACKLVLITRLLIASIRDAWLCVLICSMGMKDLHQFVLPNVHHRFTAIMSRKPVSVSVQMVLMARIQPEYVCRDVLLVVMRTVISTYVCRNAVRICLNMLTIQLKVVWLSVLQFPVCTARTWQLVLSAFLLAKLQGFSRSTQQELAYRTVLFHTSQIRSHRTVLSIVK